MNMAMTELRFVKCNSIVGMQVQIIYDNGFVNKPYKQVSMQSYEATELSLNGKVVPYSLKLLHCLMRVPV